MAIGEPAAYCLTWRRPLLTWHRPLLTWQHSKPRLQRDELHRGPCAAHPAVHHGRAHLVVHHRAPDPRHTPVVHQGAPHHLLPPEASHAHRAARSCASQPVARRRRG